VKLTQKRLAVLFAAGAVLAFAVGLFAQHHAWPLLGGKLHETSSDMLWWCHTGKEFSEASGIAISPNAPACVVGHRISDVIIGLYILSGMCVVIVVSLVFGDRRREPRATGRHHRPEVREVKS
jgi:hypothetical protein